MSEINVSLGGIMLSETPRKTEFSLWGNIDLVHLLTKIKNYAGRT